MFVLGRNIEKLRKRAIMRVCGKGSLVEFDNRQGSLLLFVANLLVKVKPKNEIYRRTRLRGVVFA